VLQASVKISALVYSFLFLSCEQEPCFRRAVLLLFAGPNSFSAAIPAMKNHVSAVILSAFMTGFKIIVHNKLSYCKSVSNSTGRSGLRNLHG
jgi:hypothetical protein